MEIKTKEIRDGEHVGEIVWVCHYLRPDLNKKPLRNIPPTKVIVKSNDELPPKKYVYYSDTHFAPINKAGKTLSKIISPVDNTGFRSRHGNELFVYTTEKECIYSWNNQIDECSKRLLEKELNASEIWRKQREELEASKYKLKQH